MRPSPSPSPLAKERRPMLAPCHPYTKNHSRIGRPRNDIYKIALNYSQIAQIYNDPVAETPKSEGS
jgi:hypothetical protein